MPHSYFANLAHLASEYSGGETALQVSALIALRKQLEVADKQGTGKATRRVIENACSHLGIAEDMMQAVFRIGAFSDNDCNWREFVVLGCALLAEDVLAACKLIFEVFSPTEDYSLPAQDFLDLFHLLTHKDDTVDDGFYQDLRTHLANDETVTFAQFCESGPGQQLVERPLSSGR